MLRFGSDSSEAFRYPQDICECDGELPRRPFDFRLGSFSALSLMSMGCSGHTERCLRRPPGAEPQRRETDWSTNTTTVRLS